MGNKNTYRLTLATLAAGVFLLLLSGCDVFGGDDEERIDQPFFSYGVYDESGDLVQTVSNEQAGEFEIETGLGLFGENFILPSIIELIAKSIGIEPEELDFSRHEIYLHAESGIADDIRFASLNFNFSMIEDWFEGEFQVQGLPKERWVESLRNLWEFRRDRFNSPNENQSLQLSAQAAEFNNQLVGVNYNEFGFNIADGQYLYLATDGIVEVVDISSDFLTGVFTIDLSGISVDILDAEEFPENPEFRNIRIVGEFAAERGDYSDLMRARADLIFGGGNGTVTFVPNE